MWLGDILSWYGEFNKVRNQFFVERGLIGKGSRQSMPASTGIGLGLGGVGQFGMDLTAVLEPAGSIEFLGAIGRQQCALDYGSAFSRASRAKQPRGRNGVCIRDGVDRRERGDDTYRGREGANRDND